MIRPDFSRTRTVIPDRSATVLVVVSRRVSQCNKEPWRRLSRITVVSDDRKCDNVASESDLKQKTWKYLVMCEVRPHVMTSTRTLSVLYRVRIDIPLYQVQCRRHGDTLMNEIQ
jgi:hypothetical protein